MGYAEALLQEACPLPADISPVISKSQFVEIVSRPRYSSPGPDGVPFAALQAGGEPLAAAMPEAYVLWTQGRPLPEAWRASVTVFLPKATTGGAPVSGALARLGPSPYPTR